MLHVNSNAYLVLIDLVPTRPFRSRCFKLFCVWVVWTYPTAKQHLLGCDMSEMTGTVVLADE